MIGAIARSAVVGALASALVAAALLLAVWGTLINHDTAWYLLATRAWLDGASLYGDLVEVNPPLTFYLTVPAVLMAETLSLDPANAQFGVVALLYWISLTWVWRLVMAREGWSDARKLILYLGVAAALSLPFLPAFAQREHLMILLMMPWMMGRVLYGPQASGDGRRAALAALGVCIKPFFVLYPIAVTLYEMALTRSLKPVLTRANLIFFGVGLAYVGLAALRHPLYFSEIIPMALLVYGDYGLSAGRVLILFAAMAVLLALGWAQIGRTARPSRRGGGILGVLAAAGLAIYLLQWTGYTYQIRPAITLLMLLFVWTALHCSRLTLDQGATSVFALVLLGSQALLDGLYDQPATRTLATHVQALDGQRLAALSTSLPPGPGVALAADVEWTSRYPALWLVPGAVNGLAETDCDAQPKACRVLEDILARTRADIVTDLVDGRPDVLIIDRKPLYIRDPTFTWGSFLSPELDFNNLMAAFEPVVSTERYDLFTRRAGITHPSSATPR